MQDAVLRDDDGDGAGHLLPRHHLLHGRADAGERRPLGRRGQRGGDDQGGDADGAHGDEVYHGAVLPVFAHTVFQVPAGLVGQRIG